MIANPDLPRRCGELLLQLLDQSEQVIAAAFMDDLPPEVGTRLIAAGALRPYTPTRAVPVADEDRDGFRDLTWYPEHGAYGYFDAADGHVVLAPEAPARYRVDMNWWLGWLATALDLTNAGRPAELVAGHAWDIGDLWVSRQRNVPVIFARQLHVNEPLAELQFALKERAGRSGGIVLTSSRSPILSSTDVQSYRVMPIGDVLTNNAEVFAIDRALVLSPYLAPQSERTVTEPLHLSPDGRQLIINGSVTVDLRSDIHIKIIRRLVDAHREQRRFRASELLEEAESSATSLKRAFGAKKWALLEPFLKSRDGLWGFDF